MTDAKAERRDREAALECVALAWLISGGPQMRDWLDNGGSWAEIAISHVNVGPVAQAIANARAEGYARGYADGVADEGYE